MSVLSHSIVSDNHPLLKVNDFIGIRPFTCMIMESLFFYFYLLLLLLLLLLL